MITEYVRPVTIEKAVEVLQRKEPVSLPIGGGSTLGQHSEKDITVVDLQALGLNYIHREAGQYIIGATTPLSALQEAFEKTDLAEAIQIQSGRNQRNMASLAGLVKKANGRSPLLTTLLALDALLFWEPGNIQVSLENWLPVRENWHEAVLIKEITFPERQFVFESIARSPKDVPILCMAVAKRSDGKLRASVGGFGKVPVLFADGLSTAELNNALHAALAKASDEWASADYRMQAGEVLLNRLSDRLLGK